MKVTVIHDQKGNLVGALRTDPQKLPDGRQALPVVRLHPGQKSHVVDVADHLKGAELLKHVAKLGGNS